jgi:hypothetical protein
VANPPRRGSILEEGKASVDYHTCFAMDNYLWLRTHGDGGMYDLSEWVVMNTTTNTSTLRELVSIAVWPGR